MLPLPCPFQIVPFHIPHCSDSQLFARRQYLSTSPPTPPHSVPILTPSVHGRPAYARAHRRFHRLPKPPAHAVNALPPRVRYVRWPCGGVRFWCVRKTPPPIPHRHPLYLRTNPLHGANQRPPNRRPAVKFHFFHLMPWPDLPETSARSTARSGSTPTTRSTTPSRATRSTPTTWTSWSSRRSSASMASASTSTTPTPTASCPARTSWPRRSRAARTAPRSSSWATPSPSTTRPFASPKSSPCSTSSAAAASWPASRSAPPWTRTSPTVSPALSSATATTRPTT